MKTVQQIEQELASKRSELAGLKNGRYAYMMSDQIMQVESEIIGLDNELRRANDQNRHNQMMADIRATSAENRQRMEAEKLEAAEAARVAELEAEKTQARTAFLANGGTDQEFTEAWPTIRLERIKAKTLEAMAQPAQPSAYERWVARQKPH